MNGDTEHEAQIIEQFTKQAESYRKLTSSLAGSVRGAGLPALTGAGAQDIVLDVCCGPGSIALQLAPLVAHVTGVDVTPAMLEQARIAQVQRNITNAAWQQGDIYALPFAAASFSLVTSGAAFHHITRPVEAFAELVRVCRPGGRIAVRDVTPLAEKVAEYDRMEILRDPSHAHALTVEELSSLGAGLPVGAPELHVSTTPHMPLDAVLVTSFPERCSLDELRAMFRADAQTGQDRLGFAAELVGEEVYVAYRQTTAIWQRL
jgi:ubiquinone/menaquinone biosynthesis C-methylase UbiE